MENTVDGLAQSGAVGVTAGPDRDRDAEDRDAKDKALAERLSAPSAFGARAKAGGQARLWTVPEERERRAVSIGWKTSLLLDVAMVATPLPLVLAVPPYVECRERDRTVGFFVGDTVHACTARGIRERWNKLDSRLKMIVRNSGR